MQRAQCTPETLPGRSVLVALTPAGRQVLLAAVPVHAQAIHEALLARLSPTERETLNAVLARITED